MTRPFELRGAYTALITTFSADRRLDIDAAVRLVRFQVDQGIDGLVPCGTTGESPTLKWEDHDRVVGAIVRAVDDAVPVLAGTGSNNTDEAVHATEAARAVGASAALLVDCYYNGPSSLELRTEYYERVLSEVSDLPIVPYVIPGRSGCALSAVDLAILHHRDPKRVPAVKEATGDLVRMRQDRSLCGDSLAIFSGDDDMTLPMMQDETIRACGVISVMSNLVPRAIADMVAAQEKGDTERVEAIRSDISPLLRLVTCSAADMRVLPDGRQVRVVDKFRNPVPVKTMMAGLGMIDLYMRPPLGKMSPAAVQACREALIEVHRRSSSLLAPIGEVFGVDVTARLEDDAVWAALARA